MTEGTKLARVLAYYGYVQSNVQSKVKIVCPFHEDVNPSMIVDLEKGTYFCFGCNKAGRSAHDFVIHQEEIDELQAYIKLTKILDNEKLYDIKDRKYMPQDDANELLLKAKDYYFNLTKLDWCGNIEDDNISNALNYMLKRGFTKRLMNDTRARYTYNRLYPLVFPILDNNKFKGWVCRTVDKETEQKRKYLYNKGFSRYTTISGTYDKGAIVIIVEGTMDMYKCKLFGVRNVGAILGWKITDNQIQKLKDQGITYVISALDNDECGRKGTAELKKHFKVTRWRYLKGCKDPGDFTRRTFDMMYAKTLCKENI